MAQAAESAYAVKHTKLYCHDALVLRCDRRQSAFPAGDLNRESSRNLWPAVPWMLAGDQLAQYS